MINTQTVINCPLCDCAESEHHSVPLPNLYSEKMALISGVSESELLLHFYNVTCLRCGLIYKKESFPTELIHTVFNRVVPDHPKGWDVMSGRFTADNFFNELALYQKAISENDTENTNRYRRALLSIVDSIYPHEPNAVLKNEIANAILAMNFSFIELSESSLRIAIKEPMPFKRFSGFSASSLYDYLESVCGKLIQYDEIGCPLWGLLPKAKEKGIDVRFIKREEVNYWQDKCRKNGIQCAEWLHQEQQVDVVKWESLEGDAKRQLLGFFQYLDHLSNPRVFLDDVFSRYQSAAVILDSVDEPVYIQHATGWSEKSIEFVANCYNKKVFADFELINPSGNRLYLFL